MVYILITLQTRRFRGAFGWGPRAPGVRLRRGRRAFRPAKCDFRRNPRHYESFDAVDPRDAKREDGSSRPGLEIFNSVVLSMLLVDIPCEVLFILHMF